MAGEGGTGGGGTGVLGAIIGSGQSNEGGSGVGGWFSRTFLGVDIPANDAKHRAALHGRRAQRAAVLAAQTEALQQRAAAAGTAGRFQSPTTLPQIAPGAPAGTGSGIGVPTGQLSWQDLLTQFGLAGIQLALELLGRKRQAAAPTGGGVVFQPIVLGGVDPMAYVVPRTGGVDQTAGMGYGISQDPFGLGSILGGVSSIIGAIKGTVAPTAMPGGAGVANVQQASALGALGTAARAVVPYIGGALAAAGVEAATGLLPSPTGGTARMPSIVVVNGRAMRSAGTPIAWSGDVTAAKRLIRAHARIGKVVHRLRPRRGGC